MPSKLKPARALKLADGRYYLLGGCDVSPNFTGLCLFRASDSTLSEFTPASGTDGHFFKVNQTLGAIDANGVWTDNNWPLGHLDAGCLISSRSVRRDSMECCSPTCVPPIIKSALPLAIATAAATPRVLQGVPFRGASPELS